MSFMDGVMGGLVSAGVTALVSNVLKQNGGLQGLVSQFEQKGLGSVVQSWVGTGTNQSIQPNQIHQALGGDMIKQLAAKVGMSETDITAKLAEFLPGAVDKMTPEGRIPAEAA